MVFMKNLKKLIYPITSRYLANATLVEGILKGTDRPIRCLFVGNTNIVGRVYEPTPRLLKSWKLWIPDLKKVLNKYSNSIDICIAVLPNNYETSFEGLYSFKGQEFIRQIIDTSGTWDEIFQAFHKKKRQYSNNVELKFGLSYQISRNIDDFDLFYYRMHLPHIKNQFDEYANIDTYEDMRRHFLKGLLLFVVGDGQKMAGALCLKEDNKLIFRRSGVLDGNEEYRKRGAQFALYHFIIRYALEQRIEKVDTMKSVPFLNDGVYRTKREWGASVYPDDEAESAVFYFISHHSKEIAAFFECNPVIIFGEDGLYGLAGWQETCDIAMLDKKELAKKYYSSGLKGLILLAPNGEKTKVIFEENGSHGQSLVIYD